MGFQRAPRIIICQMKVGSIGIEVENYPGSMCIVEPGPNTATVQVIIFHGRKGNPIRALDRMYIIVCLA